MPDPTRPEDSADKGLKFDHKIEPPQPSEVEVVQALLAIEELTKKAQSGKPSPDVHTQRSWFSRSAEILIYFSLVLAVCVFGVWGLERIAKKLLSAVSVKPGRLRSSRAA